MVCPDLHAGDGDAADTIMSGIFGVFTRGALPGRAELERVCGGLRSRGVERRAIWRGDRAALGVGRYGWELDADFSGPVLVLEESDCVVVADARLYHTADLRRRLRAAGVVPGGATPSHLILAAYRAWGEECAYWLEGEFAFVVWDKRVGRAFCARDFSGRRPLYYADLGDTLVVGSTLSAVLAHPSCPSDLNLPVLAATAGLLLSAVGAETCYRAVRVVPAAGDLLWSVELGLRLGRHWEPKPAAGVTDLSTERAAEELRELLTVATAERLAPAGPTTVWMSGGWDSTAVFGIGQALLRRESRERELLPVSISYPEGDPGREDETIVQIAGMWQAPVHWLESESIPFFAADPTLAAAQRDEPLAHLYEFWNKALAAGSRSVGARVSFDGYGGDQLFQVSDVFLADLLQRGRWLELAREWRVRWGVLGRRYLMRYTLRPLVPGWLLDLRARLTGAGRALYSHLERPVPPWIEPEAARRFDLIGQGRAYLPKEGWGARATNETHWYLTHPVLAHLSSQLAHFALSQGVEVRSPLFDRRVVEFALARPRRERAAGRETKILLRRAMRGLLPDEVLAPRPYRTGQTFGYSDRRMRESFPRLFNELFRSPLILAELGLVNPGALQRSLNEYLEGGIGNFQRVSLFYTLQTEWWLRSRLRGVAACEPGGVAVPVALGVG